MIKLKQEPFSVKITASLPIRRTFAVSSEHPQQKRQDCTKSAVPVQAYTQGFHLRNRPSGDMPLINRSPVLTGLRVDSPSPS